MRKLIVLLVSLCLVMTMAPIGVFADDQASQTGTTGETAQTGEQTAPELNGWVKESDGWKYYKKNQRMAGFKKIDGEKYYFGVGGAMQTGWKTIEGKKYYFREKGGNPETSDFGKMAIGWVKIRGYKYFLQNNGVQKTGWLNKDGNRYYLNPDSGVMATGWNKIDDNRYYFNPTSGKMKKGWLNLEGKRYYLDPKNGKQKTKWLKLNKSKYYLDPKHEGRMTTGWLKLKSKKYYFDKNSGKMKKGLCHIDGSMYYFKKGVMQTGAVKKGKKMYYFKDSGKAVTKKGWFKGSDKKRRYSYGHGRIAYGIEKIGGEWYKFSEKSGKYLAYIGDDMDAMIYDESSSTKYIVAVDRSDHLVRVYKGSAGNWKQKKEFACSVGDSSSKTPTGVFTIGSKEKMQKNSSDSVCWWYCTKFSTYHQFNSILYKYNKKKVPEPGESEVVDGRIGYNVSNGDVRLKIDNAKWIYDNLKKGTKVVIE